MRILLLLLGLLPTYIFTQHAIEFNFNQVYIGRNLSLDYQYEKNSLFLNMGTSYHINRIELMPVSQFYKKMGYASSITQRFGFQIGAGYHFFKNERFKAGIYYRGYLAHMDSQIKFPSALPLDGNPQSDQDYAGIIDNRVFGPLFTFENTLGLSIKTKLFDDFYTSIRGGFGMMFFRNYDENIFLGYEPGFPIGQAFISSWSIGLGYEF